MAQQESPREDLLREATALVERVELVSDKPRDARAIKEAARPSIVAGFRAGGGLSIFFGEDPAYHFNTVGEVRRAYVGGLIYKAIKGELIVLTRVRSADQVELRSHTLAATEQAKFVGQMSARLSDLAAELDAKAVQIRAQVPPDANVLDRLQKWLADYHEVRIAVRPNA
jgi:hypothetical protein